MLRPSKILRYWDLPEYRETFWRLQETWCHADHKRRPSANTRTKLSQIIIIIIIIIIIRRRRRRRRRRGVMKSDKRHITDGMELPNQDKMRTLGEKETFKYLGSLEVDTIRQVELKDKIQKEYLRRKKYYSRLNSLAETFTKE